MFTKSFDVSFSSVDRCFPTWVPQNVVTGSARNRGINGKKF
jgi:hypothetical protein